MLDMELLMSCALMVLLHVRLGVSAAPLIEDAYPSELSTAIPRDVYIIFAKLCIVDKSTIFICLDSYAWKTLALHAIEKIE
jgi:hypothetical protein